jgi:hypothetical protein
VVGVQQTTLKHRLLPLCKTASTEIEDRLTSAIVAQRRSVCVAYQPLGADDICKSATRDKSCIADGLEPNGQRAQGITCDVNESLACSQRVVTRLRSLRRGRRRRATRPRRTRFAAEGCPTMGSLCLLSGLRLRAGNNAEEKKNHV